VSGRPQTEMRGIGSAPRFGEPDGDQSFTPGHAGKERARRFGCGMARDDLPTQRAQQLHVGDAEVAVRHLLDDQAGGNPVDAEPAVLLGQVGGDQSQGAHLPHELPPETPLLFARPEARQKPLACEAPRRLLQGLLVLAQPEVHRFLPSRHSRLDCGQSATCSGFALGPEDASGYSSGAHGYRPRSRNAESSDMTEQVRRYGFSDEELLTVPTVFRNDLLAGSVVLVSGGGSGLGKAIACLAGRLGATLVLTGRNRERLEATQSLFQGAGIATEIRDFTIRDAEAVDAAIRDVWERHGRLDVLVNNAGGQYPQAAI